MLGGTQGNGSPATSTATANPQWTTVNGGDGGYSAINPWTPHSGTRRIPTSTFIRARAASNCTTDTFSLTVGSDEVGGDTGRLYTPYILDPQNPTEMLVGTCRVWRGAPTVPANAFRRNQRGLRHARAATCTGEEINLVSGLAEGGPTLISLSTTVYATTEGTGPNAAAPSGGEVWVTTNAGITHMSKVTGAIQSFELHDLVGGDGYERRNGRDGVHRSYGLRRIPRLQDDEWRHGTACGRLVRERSDPLPDAPVNALSGRFVSNSVGIYAGTDVGVFVSSTAIQLGRRWARASLPGATGYLPNVPVTAIRIFDIWRHQEAARFDLWPRHLGIRAGDRCGLHKRNFELAADDLSDTNGDVQRNSDRVRRLCKRGESELRGGNPAGNLHPESGAGDRRPARLTR